MNSHLIVFDPEGSLLQCNRIPKGNMKPEYNQTKTKKSFVSVKAGNKEVLKFVPSCLMELRAHFSFLRMGTANKLMEAIFDSDDEFSLCC